MIRWITLLQFLVMIGLLGYTLWSGISLLFSNVGYLAILKSRQSAGFPAGRLITYELPTGGDEEYLSLAERSFRVALDVDSQSSVALGGLGRVYSDRGESAIALSYWHRAVGIGYQGTLGYYMLGNLYAHSGVRGQALKYWEQATPTDAGNRIRLAQKVFAQGRGGYDAERWGDATQVLEDTLRIVPLTLPEQTSLRLALADMYASLGQRDQMLHHVEQAVFAMPNSAEVRSWYAWHLYYTLNNPSQALAEAQRAIQLGKEWRAYVVLGDIYLANCKLEQAALAYQSGINLGFSGDYRQWYLLIGLASVRWEQGERESAIAGWKQFLHLQPSERVRVILEEAEQNTLPRKCGKW